MEKSKLLKISLFNALGVLVYVCLVALLMFNAGGWVGRVNGPWGVAAFLLLFVVSALVTGLLVLGRPAMMYFNNAKAEAVKLLMYTVGWLVILAALVFVFLMFLRGDEDTWLCQNGQWVKHGQPSAPQPTTQCLR